MANYGCLLVGGRLTASTNEVLWIISKTKTRTATRWEKNFIIGSYIV